VRPRLIPTLLINERSLVKTIGFGKENYIGDPINAIKLFNDMEVDELIILDISASRSGRAPDMEFLRDLVSEAFIPVCYGGGVSTIEQIGNLFQLGIEKVSINKALRATPDILSNAAKMFGSQSLVASIDVKRSLFGRHRLYEYDKAQNSKQTIDEYIQQVEQLGAGEVLINFVDHDGSMSGFDLDAIARFSELLSIPLVVCGGAGSLTDLRAAVDAGASAAAAGSMFVYHGKHRGVLINYPSQEDIDSLFGINI